MTKLDTSKLLGFRIAAATSAILGSKPGSKLGNKPAPKSA